jgi:predicted RNA-binding protein with PIN domain
VLPPPALRRYLNFARLTSRSLEAIARVVERDDEFRARVAAAVDEDHVGRAAWLWLSRPDGWQAELADHEAAAAARAADAAEEREERAATRKLAAAHAAAVRSEAEARARLAELDEARTDLAREREARTTAEARVAELEARVADLTTARAEVVRNLKDVESRLVDRATEVNAVKSRIRALEAEARELRSRHGAAAGAGAGAGDGAGDGSAAEVAVGPDRPPAATGAHPDDEIAGPEAAPAAAAPVSPDPGAIADEVARAAGGAAALADALGALSRLLVGGRSVSPPPAGAPTADDARDAVMPTVGLAGQPPPPRVRRVPVTLPGGMFDDTVEAAEHLLRTPGAVLVVDGYNVTMEGWPELGAADQRRRLVAALSDLAARTATQVELVFDGAEVEPLSVPSPARQLVRVRFSDPEVEADDVVIDLVGRIPAATPVIVASSDNRVRDGSRRGGANLLHARQLVAVLRR